MKVPPHNSEAEQAILAGILINNDALNQVMDIISADDFYREAHAHTFEGMVGLYNNNEPIDLITLDMMLPDITGMEVLHRIKSDPQTADIPVIIVSVLLPEQTGEAERGAVDHITKPFAFEKLMESIRRTLGVSQMASMGAPQ